jgi:hypothetical protein
MSDAERATTVKAHKKAGGKGKKKAKKKRQASVSGVDSGWKWGLEFPGSGAGTKQCR